MFRTHFILPRLSILSSSPPPRLPFFSPYNQAIFGKLMELTKMSLQLMSLGGDGDEGGADGEGCTSEAVDKVLEAWHSVLMPMRFNSYGAHIPWQGFAETVVYVPRFILD
jgi:hypothetical protein